MTREEFEEMKKRQNDLAEQIAKKLDGYDLREAKHILSIVGSMLENSAVVTLRCE